MEFLKIEFSKMEFFKIELFKMQFFKKELLENLCPKKELSTENPLCNPSKSVDNPTETFHKKGKNKYYMFLIWILGVSGGAESNCGNSNHFKQTHVHWLEAQSLKRLALISLIDILARDHVQICCGPSILILEIEILGPIFPLCGSHIAGCVRPTIDPR